MTFTTLCYIEKNDSYLMLHRIKKEKDINKDKWIGIGGHFEVGESPEDCLLREVREETGLTLTSFQFRGIITFHYDTITDYFMCLYTADAFTGDLIDCNEGCLEWVPKQQLANLNLWEGDLIFFRLLDDNTPFFSLKLCYTGNILNQAVLNGKEMELFDIVDEKGVPTGLVRERSIIHSYGNCHRTAHVWIVRPNLTGSFDVLLQKRSAGKDSFPGCYDISSAGHIPVGCDYMESALRELSEELGITASPDELTLLGYHDSTIHTEFYGKPFRNHEYSAIFVMQKNVSPESLTLQPEEVDSVLWMDYDICLQKIQEHSFKHCIFLEEFQMLRQVNEFI